MHTDAMDILVNATVGGAWEIVIDNMHHVLDIQATSGDTCSNQDWSLAGAESTTTRDWSASAMEAKE